jgi:hypothetical protein
MAELGDVVGLSITVKNAAGVPTNAGTMTLSITQPDGTAATITNPVAGTSGVYTYDFTPTQAGRHEVRWLATGANAGAFSDALNVDPAASGAIVSLAEVKAHLNLTSTTDDEELRAAALAASAWVESKIGPVARRTQVETLYPTPAGTLFLTHAPVISVTTIAGAYGYTAGYDPLLAYLDSDAGVLHAGIGRTFGYYPLTVTYVAGRAVVPAPIRWATLEYVAWLWDTQRGPAQLSPAQADLADLGGTGAFATVPRRIEAALEPYLQVVVA